MASHRVPSVLFVQGVGADNVVLNWIGKPAEKLDLYADAYHRAGRRLADEYGTTGAARDFEACPLVFLYRHSLELYLKAILIPGDVLLRLRGEAAIDLTSHLHSHRLIDLLPDFGRVIGVLGWGWNMGVQGLRTRDEFRDLVNELDRVDPRSFSFRYPLDTEGAAPLPDRFSFSVATFASRMDALLGVLDGAVGGVEEAVRSATEAREYGR